jgi:hypothetical protein
MFKKMMIPFAASAALLAGAAYAETTSGAIADINDSQDWVKLENGNEFYFEPNTDLSGFLAGNVVSIEWALNGDRMEAETISGVDNSAVVTGVVNAADMTANTLTIDGKVYYFGPTVDLKDIKEGDSVRVTFVDGEQPQGMGIFVPVN